MIIVQHIEMLEFYIHNVLVNLPPKICLHVNEEVHLVKILLDIATFLTGVIH